MGDIRLIWDPSTATADFNIVDHSLELGHDLETAILISLFTDATASPDDVIPPDISKDPRGWWANIYETQPIGSKLWQAFWRVRNDDTLNWARNTAQIALQWMIDDGVAQSVTVQPQFYGSGGLALTIYIVEPSGDNSVYRYAWAQER
jgi:phage gp46-like protein